MKLFDKITAECRTASDAEFKRVIDAHKSRRLRWWIGMHVGGSYCYRAAFEASVKAATVHHARFAEMLAEFRIDQGLPA